jgi:cysteinyl-tRNA synthetase
MKLYNSLTKKKEPFVPIQKQKVSLYVCGITPYDTTHLGHAFTYVFFDSLVRLLTYKGFEVNYTQNVTDIDDDILKRAKKENRDWKELGTFWTDKFLTDMSALDVLPPTHYVKATDSIATIITIVKKLLAMDVAYEKEGNVYFDVSKKQDYGKLSQFSTHQMELISSERGANIKDPRKKNPLDFVLWQKSQKDEPFWESPWDKGRPGWHIECSAMVYDYLGPQIDIHGGGRDLIFPHHESEIAQSESFTKKSPYVKQWLHTAMLLYQGEKMSKSLGNLVMVSDLIVKYDPSVIRFALLSHHYRNPWEFYYEQLEESHKNLQLLVSVAKKVNLSTVSNEFVDEFLLRLDDDMNTEKALVYLVELAKNKPSDEACEAIYFGLKLLGITV